MLGYETSGRLIRLSIRQIQTNVSPHIFKPKFASDALRTNQRPRIYTYRDDDEVPRSSDASSSTALEQVVRQREGLLFLAVFHYFT